METPKKRRKVRAWWDFFCMWIEVEVEASPPVEPEKKVEALLRLFFGSLPLSWIKTAK